MKFVRYARWGGGLSAAALLVPALIAVIPAADAATVASGRPAAHKPFTISESSLMKSGNQLLKPDTPGTFPIVNNDSNRCLGIAADGNAGIWDCTGGADQSWYNANESPTGWTQLVNLNGDCLDTADTTASNGVQVVADSCNNTLATQFWWGSHGRIYNLAACSATECFRLLGVRSGSIANGAPVVIWQDNGNPDHNWSW
jgi:Ricin-type beta-trefoil lectin domain